MFAGRALLHLAAFYGRAEVLQLLCEGIQCEVLDSHSGESLGSILAPHLRVHVNVLTTHTPPNGSDGQGTRQQACHLAVECAGQTPLHVACARGHAEAAGVLTACGAGQTLRDAHGRTALDLSMARLSVAAPPPPPPWRTPRKVRPE